MPSMPTPPNDNVFDFPHLGASSGTLRIGSKSAEVADLQRNLQRLGFVGIRADGTYDQALAQVIMLVQRALVRPETGEVDSFIDASITRATDNAQSMEALRIGVVAREWSQTQAGALVAQQQTVQIVQDDQPFYAKAGFWLAAAGAIGFYFLIRRVDEPSQPVLMGLDDDGIEDPEDFLSGHGDKPKKKRKKLRKKTDLADAPDDLPALTAGEPEVLPDDAPEPTGVIDVTPPLPALEPGVADAPRKRRRKLPKRDATGAFLPRGASLADAFLEKPKKRKKQKARALAESAPAPNDEIQGAPGDPDAETDIGGD